jgi:hypothetical protein
VITSKAANGDHFKTGQRTTFENKVLLLRAEGRQGHFSRTFQLSVVVREKKSRHVGL